MNLYKYIEANDLNLSKNESRIRQYLLENYDTDFSTKKISQDLYMSPSTVSRYLKKIRYESIYKLNADKILDDQNYQELFANIVATKQELLERTIGLNSIDQIREFAYEIDKAKTIYIYGMGYSSLEGKNLQLRLSRIGYRVILLYNRHDMMMLSSSKEMKDSVCLFISQTGETRELIQIANFLKNYKVEKLLITNNRKSSLAKMCDQILIVPKIESGYKIEIIFSEITVNLLLDLIYAVLLMENYEKSIELYMKTCKFLKK